MGQLIRQSNEAFSFFVKSPHNNKKSYKTSLGKYFVNGDSVRIYFEMRVRKVKNLNESCIFFPSARFSEVDSLQ